MLHRGEVLPSLTSGSFREIIDDMRKRATTEALTRSLAFDCFYGARTFDYELAALAADRMSELLDDDDEEGRFEWDLNAAEARAHLGDLSSMDLMQARAADLEHASVWANLSFAWRALDKDDASDAAALRAMEIDPEHIKALTAQEEAAVHRGDIDAALASAHRILELHPHEHQGPERLGLLYGKIGDTEKALHFANWAVDAAPYCHISHRSAAVAHFCAGALEEALTFAQQALNIDNPEKESDDALMIQRALSGDLDGLERGIELLTREGRAEVWADYLARLRAIARERVAVAVVC